MRFGRSVLMLATALCLTTWVSTPVLADHDKDESGHGRYRGGEYKEKFRDGPCKVERELKSDGSYKEERECKGAGGGPYGPRGEEYEEKYWDGPCKVEREWKRDGTYKEKIDCAGHGQGSRHRHAPVVLAEPPWIVFERSGPVYRKGWEPREVVSAPSGGIFRCNRELIGGVIGGVTGAALGSQIGKGDERTVATIGGAIAGVLVGGAIGRGMDAQDQACIGRALEFAKTGQKVNWHDRDTGVQYAVTPERIERRPDGRYCRRYDTDVVIEGKHNKVRGIACRQPDGVWIRRAEEM
jgi:surface antigen